MNTRFSKVIEDLNRTRSQLSGENVALKSRLAQLTKDVENTNTRASNTSSKLSVFEQEVVSQCCVPLR